MFTSEEEKILKEAEGKGGFNKIVALLYRQIRFFKDEVEHIGKITISLLVLIFILNAEKIWKAFSNSFDIIKKLWLSLSENWQIALFTATVGIILFFLGRYSGRKSEN